MRQGWRKEGRCGRRQGRVGGKGAEVGDEEHSRQRQQVQMCNAAGLSAKGRTSAAAELDVFFLAFIASSHALMASSTDGSTSRGPPGQFMSADLFASGFPDTRLGSETEPPPPPPLPPLLLAFSH